jgi:transketolase
MAIFLKSKKKNDKGAFGSGVSFLGDLKGSVKSVICTIAPDGTKPLVGAPFAQVQEQCSATHNFSRRQGMNSRTPSSPAPIGQLTLSPRRAAYVDISEKLKTEPSGLAEKTIANFEAIDLVYRTLCGILYNFVPTSGHPGGSISSGRIVEALIYHHMDYDFSNPDLESADMLCYAAGHKAMGLYAMWALRNELVRIARPELLPAERKQLRLEDLLGFRRNPTQDTPLFKKLHARALDGHPTPATPFVRIATGASGVGVPAALGLAMASLDMYGAQAPKVHMIEGEGGMTPGRVHEALAGGATAGLRNAVLHVDWNQASIDSDRVCAEGGKPGDYVQWSPAELLYTHDWNVIFVPDGLDFHQIFAAQSLAATFDNAQPTAIVYRTVKGWNYGIQGKASHGAGHKFCSDGYYEFIKAFEKEFVTELPRFKGEATPENVETAFHDTLMTLRETLTKHLGVAFFAAERVSNARARLHAQHREKRPAAPQREKIYAQTGVLDPDQPPEKLRLKAGDSVTLRAVLGDALNEINKLTGGGVIGSAADLLGSTSVSNLAQGFPSGLYHSATNPGSRLIAVGGICEDAMGAFMAGLSSFGHHIGVTSSYGAFIGALEHVAARLHGIGQQAKRGADGPYDTWILINAHAGLKTGEDGPTHADPQVLQLLQENFPRNVLITLTPWDPQEIWPLLIAGLLARPAVLSPFVTRPPEVIIDRKQHGLPPASAAKQGVYAMRLADLDSREYHGTLVLQGNGVAYPFVTEVLPAFKEHGLNMNVFYVASAELFDRLPVEEQDRIFPEVFMQEAMGITDFTMPTMHRWVRSHEGLRRSLHSFRDGKYLGSGQAHMVLREAGLDAKSQLNAILDYAHAIEKKTRTERRVVATTAPERKTKPVFADSALVCSDCGARIDPREYFSGAPLPEDDICLECDWRGPEACAYCQAHWLIEHKSIQFRCKMCEKKMMEA